MYLLLTLPALHMNLAPRFSRDEGFISSHASRWLHSFCARIGSFCCLRRLWLANFRKCAVNGITTTCTFFNTESQRVACINSCYYWWSTVKHRLNKVDEVYATFNMVLFRMLPFANVSGVKFNNVVKVLNKNMIGLDLTNWLAQNNPSCNKTMPQHIPRVLNPRKI